MEISPNTYDEKSELVEGDDFEFVELQNTGTDVLDLNGMRFVDGITFDFTGSAVTNLAPGNRVLVVRNQPAFEVRYGTALNPLIAGQYSGGLTNGGEQVRLVNALDQVLQEFTYDDEDDWSLLPDGFGSTLEVINPLTSLNDVGNWRASSQHGGTPGSAGLGLLDSVVVNEVLSHPSTANVDAIELFNPTSTAIDIGGWWLSNSLDQLDRHVIPSPTIIPANDYLALDETDFFLGPISQDKHVVLVEPNALGLPGIFVNHVAFGGTRLGESLGRWPNGMGEMYPMEVTTLGAANSGPRVGPVVITEVMFHPQDLDQGIDAQLLEFLEIYNPSPQVVDLSNGEIRGVGFDVPSDTSIGPGEVLVFVPFDPVLNTTAIALFEDAYHVDLSTDGSRYRFYSGRLNNGGENLTLFRPDDSLPGNPAIIPLLLEDQVIYDDQPPWPSADGTGLSLKRKLVDLWGNDPGSWESGKPTPGHLERQIQAASGQSTAVIGEVGNVENLTDQPQTITLSRTYTHPVVFAQPATFNGTDQVVVRLSSVQPNQFELFLAEPSNLNGLHGVGESVSYVVLEAGSHWLSDGTHLEVGTIDTGASVGTNIGSPGFTFAQFPSLFAQPPVAFSQPQTMFGETFLSTRQLPPTTYWFGVALEPEEQFGPQLAAETIGYLAIDAGPGTWNGMPLLAGTSSAIDDSFQTVSLTGTSFDSAPSLIASLASYDNNDHAHLRLQQVHADSFAVKIEEDTTWDTETSHSSEDVAFLAVGGQGSLTTVTTLLADNATTMFTLDVTEAGRVLNVTVHLDLVHPHVEDLDIYLESPDGTLVELMSDVGGGGDNVTGTTFTDEATTSIASATAPFGGEFQPLGSLKDFAGKEINGTWSLKVTDDSLNRLKGALLDWSLDIELAPEGNLNYDSQLDATDIDLLFAKLGSADATYDLDNDGDADQMDVDHLVLTIMEKRYGDADLDQDVDITDFGRLVRHFDPLGWNGFASWSQGNFDGDNDVDINDFNQLATNFAPLGYSIDGLISIEVATGHNMLNVETPSLVLKQTPSVDDGQEIQKTPLEPLTSTQHSAPPPSLNDGDVGVWGQPEETSIPQRKRAVKEDVPEDQPGHF